MNFDEYQDFTDSTAIYPKNVELAYVTCGLVGEACEFAAKVNKLVWQQYTDLQNMYASEKSDKKRDQMLLDLDNLRRLHSNLAEAASLGLRVEKLKKDIRGGTVSMPTISIPTEEVKTELKKELGDTFWYQARAARALNEKMSKVADANVQKLNSRKDRGVLHGSGDNR